MSNRRTAHRVSRVSAVALASAFLVSTASADAFAQAAPPAAEAKPKPAEAQPPGAETKPADAKPAPAPAVKPETKPTTAPTAAPTTPPPAAPAPTAPAAKRAAPADVEAAPPLAEEPAPAAPPAAPPPAETRVAPTNATALWPQPSEDAAALAAAPNEAKVKQPAIDPADAVYAADWWSHARPVVELHGYFRFRAQLMHRFALGRVDPVAEALWARPADDQYPLLPGGNPFGPALCTDSEADEGESDDPSTASNACKQGTQAGANIRFRLAPELHISDNLRVLSQIDLLDNLVLGSTPGGNRYAPSAGGYTVSARDGYTPLAFDDDTQDPPASGVNSFSDSIRVKRAWAEYATPIGELRFGRMPAHFGLGIFWNAGDGHDDDYQSTVDRLQLITGIKPLDIYFSGAWDFPNEGATSDTVALPNPEPYDLAQLDDVDQYMLSAVRKKSPELERLSLSRGELVLNGGVQLVYRAQRLANDRTSGTSPTTGTCDASAWALGCRPRGTNGGNTYVRRGAEAWIPDVWFELLYKKFRFAAEAVSIQGSIESIETSSNPQIDSDDPGYDIESYAIATELEQLLVEDKLKLGFKFGWASGDADVPSLTPGLNGTQRQLGDRTFETFRFHPSYRVDMILHRNLLTRVQGTYYFRPNVDYDFLRDPNGQRLGGGIAAIWSRASQFMQAPGHERDLGIELNGRLYYQAKDGALNDIAGSLGGFYTELDYGVLFPMAGLGYTDRVAADQNPPETRIAQTLRWYLGVMF